MSATCPAHLMLAILPSAPCLNVPVCLVSADIAAVHGEMCRLPGTVAQGVLPHPILFVAAVL